LAKKVIQHNGADRKGHELHRSKISRAGMMTAITALRPKLVVMEACCSAHHWARRLKASPFKVFVNVPA
jgi:transposase